MAKNKYKKYKQSYVTGGRVDMSNGGRVSYARGDRVDREREEDRPINLPGKEPKVTQPGRPGPGLQKPPVNKVPPKPPSIGGVGGGGNIPDETPRQVTPPRTSPMTPPRTPASDEAMRKTTAQEGDPVFDEARRERIRETGLQIEAGSTGDVPFDAKIAGIDEAGTRVQDIKQTNVVKQDPNTKAGAKTTGVVAPETVTTGGEAVTGTTGDAITTDTFTAKQVGVNAQVGAAQTSINDNMLAEAAGVNKVDPINTATVDIPEGALAERVVGTLSPEAKAEAAKNAGTDLARVTRAKKQLRNAGLQEDAITELGNDPEALEDKLTQFTEQERGIIAGLPEEALVSNQIDSLLKGMEEGEIPTWAKPAVASVEAMLARRGLSASSVGRDNLFNAIIQSAVPIAQSNAQAIQQSVSQQRSIEAQVAEANAQRQQQTALQNAQSVFQMDMAQFNADQQTSLSNSKFLQTVSLTEAAGDQQTIIQNAALMSQANLAEASLNQQAQIQNAKNFLAMDMANLNAEQQSNVLRAQQTQQRLLSNQAATNAAAQFNAASENQTNQFMASLNAQVEQYNKTQMNAMEQFNATQANAASARDAQRVADVEKFNTQLAAQIEQFNSNQDFARNQWNAQNQAAVEQSNTQWRRQVNTANTAMQNQINMQNAQNAFNLSGSAMSFLWQEMRDQADYDFRASENEKNRIAQIVNTALASTPDKYGSSISDVTAMIRSIFGTG